MSTLDVLSDITAQLDNQQAAEQVQQTTVQEQTAQGQQNIQPQQATDNQQSVADNIYSQSLDGLQQSIDIIFSAVIIGGIDRTNIPLIKAKQEVFKQAYAKFKSIYSENIFTNEYAFLHSVLTTLKISVFTWPQLETIINNSADDILSSERIDLSTFAIYNGIASTDEEKLEAFKYIVKTKFDTLSNQAVTLDEFESACALYNSSYIEVETTVAINEMAIMMTSGLSKRVGIGRKRVWKGSADCREYFRRKNAILDSLTDDSTKVRSVVIDEKWLSAEYEDNKSDDAEILIDTGITEIDSVHGGLHRGNIFETMGPPKGGKTTFTAYLVARCLDAGLNVAVWPLEGTKEEWLAHIQANMLRKRGRKGLVKKAVLEHTIDNPVDEQLLASAKSDLAIGKSRGRLSFLEGLCYVEDLQDVLLDHYNTQNAFDVIVIDSPVLILSHTGKSKPDRIGEGYTTLKNFINNRLKRKALALVTAQLKQTVVDELRANPAQELSETAGGESSETIRTPDYIVCVVSTKEERRNGLCKFQDVAVRHTETFRPFYCRAELGSAYFYSDPGLNTI